MWKINVGVITARALPFKRSYFVGRNDIHSNNVRCLETREENPRKRCINSSNTRLKSAIFSCFDEKEAVFFFPRLRSRLKLCNYGISNALAFFFHLRTRVHGKLKMQIVLKYVTRIHGRASWMIYVCLRNVNHRRLLSPLFFQTHRRFPGPPRCCQGAKSSKAKRVASSSRLVRRVCLAFARAKMARL